jgi:hypothetical protein
MRSSVRDMDVDAMEESVNNSIMAVSAVVANGIALIMSVKTKTTEEVFRGMTGSLRDVSGTKTVMGGKGTAGMSLASDLSGGVSRGSGAVTGASSGGPGGNVLVGTRVHHGNGKTTGASSGRGIKTFPGNVKAMDVSRRARGGDIPASIKGHRGSDRATVKEVTGADRTVGAVPKVISALTSASGKRSVKH